jgi:hypothetical protein
MTEPDYRTWLPTPDEDIAPREGSEAMRAHELGREFHARVGRAPTLAEARFMRTYDRVPSRQERRALA